MDATNLGLFCSRQLVDGKESLDTWSDVMGMTLDKGDFSEAEYSSICGGYG